MTCIVLLKDGPFMYMAGDRRVESSGEYSRYPMPKVVNKGGVLIGGAGRMSLMEEILYGYALPKHAKSLSNLEYIRKTIYLGIVNHLKDLDEAVEVDDKQIAFLIGYEGLAFELSIDDKDTDFGMVQAKYAIGSGAPYAKGVMSALVGADSPERVIEKAMLAAAEWDTGCSAEYDVIKVKCEN